jgi:hypothetical protein
MPEPTHRLGERARVVFDLRRVQDPVNGFFPTSTLAAAARRSVAAGESSDGVFPVS